MFLQTIKLQSCNDNGQKILISISHTFDNHRC